MNLIGYLSCKSMKSRRRSTIDEKNGSRAFPMVNNIQTSTVDSKRRFYFDAVYFQSNKIIAGIKETYQPVSGLRPPVCADFLTTTSRPYTTGDVSIFNASWRVGNSFSKNALTKCNRIKWAKDNDTNEKNLRNFFNSNWRIKLALHRHWDHGLVLRLVVPFCWHFVSELFPIWKNATKTKVYKNRDLFGLAKAEYVRNV